MSSGAPLQTDAFEAATMSAPTKSPHHPSGDGVVTAMIVSIVLLCLFTAIILIGIF